MTERERIAHVLRRLGMGAGRYEVAEYEPLGLDGTLDRLINWESVDEQFPISPWELAATPEGEPMDLNPFPMANYWALRMLMTKTPLRERLTLFWHDHMPVSAEKVGDGPAMLHYMQNLRENAGGQFRDVLKGGVKTGAMIQYLDQSTSFADMPNENLARELLELFTVGEGNYTERDIQECSRALTGWMLHFSGLGDSTPFNEMRERAAKKGRSVFAFCEVPAYHDNGLKTIMGKTSRFDGDEVLTMLADHPLTAKYITGKLFQWFVGFPASEATNERLANIYLKEATAIRPVVRAIAESDEFWSDRSVRKKVKSPVDYTLTLFRQLALNTLILQIRGNVTDPYTPLNAGIKGISGGLAFLMSKQGLFLLYPPNVGGWDWGEGWISTTNTIERINHAQVIMRPEDPNRPLAVYMAQKLSQDVKPLTSRGIVDYVIDVFDGVADEAARKSMADAVDAKGGPGALGDKETASVMLADLCKLIFSVPDFQLC